MSVRAYRAAMIAGAVSALLIFFGTGQLFGPTPDTSNKSATEVAQRYAAFLDKSSHRTGIVTGTFMLLLAAIGLIWFASAIRARLDRTGPMAGFALLAAVGLALGSAGPLALIGGYVFSSDPLPTNGDVIWMVFSLAYPTLLLTFGFGMSAFIASVAFAGRGVLPAWLVWFGWLAAVAGLFGVVFIPLAVVLLWLLVAGVYGALRPAAPTPATTTV